MFYHLIFRSVFLSTNYMLFKHISKSGPTDNTTFSDSFWEIFNSQKFTHHKKLKPNCFSALPTEMQESHIPPSDVIAQWKPLKESNLGCQKSRAPGPRGRGPCLGLAAPPPRVLRDGEPSTSKPPAPGDQLRGCSDFAAAVAVAAAAAIRLNPNLSHWIFHPLGSILC